jgi:hypothetical protein
MNVTIRELVYNPIVGHDQMFDAVVLDYQPHKCGSVEEAAKGLYEALCKAATEMGINPDTEVHIMPPSEKPHGYSQWVVSWEAGPSYWAIGASCAVTGPWGYTEPHYPFDLCFVEN